MVRHGGGRRLLVRRWGVPHLSRCGNFRAIGSIFGQVLGQVRISRLSTRRAEADPHLEAVQQELGRLLPLLRNALGSTIADEDDATSEGLDLTSEMLERLPQLLDNIQVFQTRVSRLKEAQSIDDIENFAGDILALAEAAGYAPLANWAKRLEEAASMFDMEAVSAALDQFAIQVDDIRQILS